jgi:hypothetical protein
MAWSALGVLSRFLSFSVVLAFAWSCASSDSNDDPSQFDWSCLELSALCSCEAMKPGAVRGGGSPVEVCASDGCCLLTEQETDFAYASCECFEGDATSCEAEAASRRNTTVVDRCPPGADAPACAALAENCRQEYLDDNGLAGCCDGSICRTSTEGVPVCQAASAEEVALAEQCDDVARGSSLHELEVLTPSVRTSLGELRVDTVRFAYNAAGPGGCFNGLDIKIGTDGVGCSFDFIVSVSDGVLEVTDFTASIDDCEGFAGGAGDGFLYGDDPIPFDFRFEGLACDGHLIFESYCAAGTFDFHLQGTFDGVTFEDQVLSVRGVVCSAEPEGECPAN